MPEFRMLFFCPSLEKPHGFSFFCVFILVLLLDLWLVKVCLSPFLDWLEKRYGVVKRIARRKIAEYKEKLPESNWFTRKYRKITIWMYRKIWIWVKLLIEAFVAFLDFCRKCIEFIWRCVIVLFRRLFKRNANPEKLSEVFKDDGFLKIFTEEKIPNVNDGLAEKLNRYLGKAAPGRAVYINGEWGSGKTYFINHYAYKKKKCYLSLFGVKDKKDFEYRIWKGRLVPDDFKFTFFGCLFGIFWMFVVVCVSFFLAEKLVQMAANWNFWKYLSTTLDHFYKGISSFAVLKCVAGQLTMFGGLCVVIWMLIRFDILKTLLKKNYLVFDDFERAEAPCEDVLSWVNEYIEHLKIPVILIGNEEEVINKICREHLDAHGQVFVENYKKSKEKVILWEARIKQDDYVVFMSYLENLGKKNVFERIILQ